MAAAAATFSDSVAAASGIVARKRAAAWSSADNPAPSLPNSHATGRFKSS